MPIRWFDLAPQAVSMAAGHSLCTCCTAELITEHGCGITWYDRFTPPRPLYPLANVDSVPSVPASAVVVPADAGVQVTPRALMPAAVNHSNRVKFTCRGCDLNVWGKPSARVACMGCELELMPLETVENPSLA